MHVLGVFTHGPGQIYNTKRPINSLKDLEGLKIRVGGGLVNEIAKALGTVPMLKPAPESYELIDQGVADGVFFPKESPVSFKLVPLIKHITYVPGGLYNVSFAWIVNPAKWKQISEADRAAITSCPARRWRAARARPGTPPTPRARRQCATPRSRSSMASAAVRRRDQGARPPASSRRGSKRRRPRASTARRRCGACAPRSPRCQEELDEREHTFAADLRQSDLPRRLRIATAPGAAHDHEPRQPLDLFDRAIVPALGYVAAVVMFCLMLLTCVDVVGRYFFSKPLPAGSRSPRSCSPR